MSAALLPSKTGIVALDLWEILLNISVNGRERKVPLVMTFEEDNSAFKKNMNQSTRYFRRHQAS